MKILGIETSCDDTGVAIYNTVNHSINQLLYSQIDLHNQFGGIIPELASRDHIRKIYPLLKQLLQESKHKLSDLDGFSYTAGPGLTGALLVGATFTKSLAWAEGKPCIGVNHLEAHLLACMLESSAPCFPFIGLLVSGGHTVLVHAKSLGNYIVLGESVDDAAGECFDKTAKLLNLGYPGGPKISNLAKSGNKKRFKFPKPMINQPNLNFSFSGLKTHIRLLCEKIDITEQDVNDISYALETTIVDILLAKTKKAILQTKLKQLVLAGGVAANQPLQSALQKMCDEIGIDFFCPSINYCTDNGAMVAYTGYRYLINGMKDSNLSIKVHSKWPLINNKN